MFLHIFRYEIASWAKKPAPYLYFFSIWGMAFLSFAGSAGFFDPPPAGGYSGRLLNSPLEIHSMLLYFNKLFLFLLPAILGATLSRDYETRMHRLLYSFPIRKRDYLAGKFLSGGAVVVLIVSAAGLGILVAEQLPGLHIGKTGTFRPAAYLQTYGVFIVPNMLICGAVVFALVSGFRSIYAGFGGVIFLLLFQIMSENVFAENGFLLALSDPFGQNAATRITRFWTMEEQNSRMVPVMGLVLLNRLLWLGLAALMAGLAYRQFSFSESLPAFFLQQRTKKSMGKPVPESAQHAAPARLAFDFSFLQQAKTAGKRSLSEFGYVVKSPLFGGLSLAILLTVLLALRRVIDAGDMTLLPVTRLILAVPAFFFSSMVILLTFLYSGLLLHRERTCRMDLLTSAAPMPGWVLLAGKALAIFQMQVLLLLGFWLTGVGVQLFYGYGHLEMGLYFFHLFALILPALVIWTLLALLIHTLIPNTYIGLFVLLLGWLGTSSLPQIGISSRLFLFNEAVLLSYSDLNGYGDQLAPYFLVKSYWMAWGLLLLLVAGLLWVRGMPLSLAERLREAQVRFTRPLRLTSLVLLVVLGLLGAAIYRAEQQMLAFSAKTPDAALRLFEEKYGRYAHLPQPEITRMKVALDFYPQTRQFQARGSYTLVNTTAQAIDTLLLKTGFDEITVLEPDRPGEWIREDRQMQVFLRKLQPALLPGDSMTMRFYIENQPNTLLEKNSNVLENGTFLRQDILPRVGYFPPTPLAFPPASAATARNYQAPDAHRIDCEITLSTDPDQIALAPGSLKNTWVEGGRRYFTYHSGQKIKYAFGFHSGRFAVKEDTWRDVRLLVYHHPTHTHNLTRLMAGLKAALDYHTHYFGPYPFDTVRIIEFPQSEGTFATAYANNIPVSEARFIARPDVSGTKIDLPFYIPAHELTHQWWGNQLLPADAPGAWMLTESITEYLSLNMYRRQYGEAQALQFLALQQERYLRGRTEETTTEPPLMQVQSHQQYLAYGKGTHAFYVLGHYMGEESLNGTLRAFLDAYRDKGPPYPTSADLLAYLKAATPDSLQYLIRDLFETVTLYDNALESATVTPVGAGAFQVDVVLDIQKTGGDGAILAVLADFIELSILDEAGNVLAQETHKITQRRASLRLLLHEPPAQVVLDPRRLLMDRDREDYVRWIQ